MDANALKKLKRKELQTLAMNHGLKGNLKSESLVKALLARFPNGVPANATDENPVIPAPSRETALVRDSPQASNTHEARLLVARSSVKGQHDDHRIGTHVDLSDSRERPSSSKAQVNEENPQEASEPRSEVRPLQTMQSLGVFTLSSASRSGLPNYIGQSVPAPSPPTSRTLAMGTLRPASFSPRSSPESASVSRPPHAQASQATNWPGGYSFPPVVQTTSSQQIPYAMAAATRSSTSNASVATYTGLPHPGFQKIPSPVYVHEQRREQSPSPWDDQGSPRLHINDLLMECSHLPISSTNKVANTDHGTQAEEEQEQYIYVTEEDALATDRMLYDAVCEMAHIAKFRDETDAALEKVENEDVRMKDGLSHISLLIQQERDQLARIRTYISHVNVELAPRWREDVIWNKGCATYLNESGEMVEYETDDEAAPKSPQPIMKWYQPAQENNATEEGLNASGASGATKEVVTPQTPKRRRADENDSPHPVTKKVRRSAGATPAPSRRTRAAARRPANDDLILGEIAEEEEEQVATMLHGPAWR
ncbi:hypothetical protein C8Q74DRAFT_1277658 [Fomes fomentarius]|nr:hypothetical protein C8Q74DRAFT_1277658 [Fomes fomentarius]